METNSIRVFIAMPICKEAEDEIYKVRKLIQSKISEDVDVTWEPVRNYHITMRFLGDVDIDQYQRLRRVDASVHHSNYTEAKNGPVQLRCSGIGVFPDWDAPNVLWMGVDGETKRLEKVYDNIDTIVRRAGFSDSAYSFHPHITLGRVKNATPEQTSEIVTAVRSTLIHKIEFEVQAIHVLHSVRKTGIGLENNENNVVYEVISQGHMGHIPTECAIYEM